jgi:MoaA/NifB/PqqE/SkfB family radical SAM enzyme
MELKNIGFYTLSDKRAKNTSETSQMKRCEMIITEYCNFKCPYCRGLKNEIYGDRNIKQLSLNEIIHNIDLWCENKPLENIRFSGGEPTLHKNIVEIVDYAKRKGIKRIAISTNGSNKIELYKNLIKAGCNDFSISLDANCASDGDMMAGYITGSWNIVVENIKSIAKLTYVTVGIGLTPENVEKTINTIEFAHKIGVDDVRIISAAQWNKPIPKLNNVKPEIRKAHPILNYRIKNFASGRGVRGIKPTDAIKCALVLDDSVIAGDYHFPCVVYMRENGNPIGKASENMRTERKKWFDKHNSANDTVCRKNCLDVCIDYNNKYKKLHTHL